MQVIIIFVYFRNLGELMIVFGKHYPLPTNESVLNKNLIFIVGQIGTAYKDIFNKSKESVTKKGIRKILLECEKRGLSVSKTEVKYLLKPKGRKGYIKIPKSTYKIFKVIVDIIEKDKYNNYYLLNKCRAQAINSSEIKCRNLLINDLFKVMRINSELDNEFAQDNYLSLKEFDKICEKGEIINGDDK